MAFVQAINDTPDAVLRRRDGARLDVDRFLTHLAIENAIAEGDGIVGDQGLNNFYLYEYGAKNRFVFIPWDKDNTFRSGAWPLYRNLETNVLTRRLTADPAKRAGLRGRRRARRDQQLRQPPLAHPAARGRLPADPARPRRPTPASPTRMPQFEAAVERRAGVIAARESDVQAQR